MDCPEPLFLKAFVSSENFLDLDSPEAPLTSRSLLQESDNHSTKRPVCTFTRRPELKHLPPDPYKGVWEGWGGGRPRHYT